MYTSPKSAYVAVDGPLDAHVAEIGIHVAEHLTLITHRDVTEPGMHVVLHLPVYRPRYRPRWRLSVFCSL